MPTSSQRFAAFISGTDGDSADSGSSQLQAGIAAATARVFAGEVGYEVYKIKASNTVEEAFQHIQLITGLIYVCGSVAATGIMAVASGTTYLSRIRKFMTEVRAVGDENFPVIIGETARSERQSALTYVYGTANDLLVLVYRR
jgi:hypothetical protein